MAKLAFYTDESVNVAVTEGLKRRGIKVISTRDAKNRGLSDKEQLERATKKKLIIIRADDKMLKRTMKLENKRIVYNHQQKDSVGKLIKILKIL